ncbi:MAG: extracellular solute-binding protein [Kiritimatiellae bacterium]|nr:extracellular solute-binding protein [Kiritimatiellia bacterium]
MSLLAAILAVSFLWSFDPEHPEEPVSRAILDLARQDPAVKPEKWGGLILPGAGGRSTFMLALAGGNAPDIYKAWFHILRHDIDQGFVYPLDEWLDAKDIPQDNIWDRVRVKDGHVWAVPTPGVQYYGIIYRKDLARAADLDPASPPRTWEEFRAWCRALKRPGVRPFAVENRPWGFLPWVQSAGGDVVNAQGTAATFDCPAALEAAGFLQELVREDLILGFPTLTQADEISQRFAAGEIAMVFGGETLVKRLVEVQNFPAELIGMMPFPSPSPEIPRVLQAHKHFYALSESVAHQSREARDLAFRCLMAMSDEHLADEEVALAVREGRAFWLEDNIKNGLADGSIRPVTEPWAGFWQAASDLVQRRFLGLLLSDAGRDFDYVAALRSIIVDATRGLMFSSDSTRLDRVRPYARVMLGAVLACALVALLVAWRYRPRSAPGGKWRLVPWFFLLPAVASILLWSYYPLFRGAFMAFQDYRIVGQSAFAGLDNFIRVALDPNVWAAWVRTFEYVAITLLLGFLTPIFLALMLCEIPKGKVFFRFLYFLPHLTSALVVTLLWKLMFDPTENGILNQIVMSLGFARQSWLLDPKLAMVCCILPRVWAGAGISSLIYIAALSSLPSDYYEAAAIDGAGILGRFRHITFPQLAPLMVINFVGAFIAAFQGMGSIFLLTFGGPGDATQVLSLQIWKEAYNNLRFSTATTMAWFLGVALIGFTYLQIRFLRRVEFRQASAN